MQSSHDRAARRVRDFIAATPYFRLLNLRVTRILPGKIWLRLEDNPSLLHAGGVMHGGAIASLADAAAANACSTEIAESEFVTTVELKINYLRPVRGGRLAARGSVVHRGRRTRVAEVDVFDAHRRLVAKALATCAVLTRSAPPAQAGASANRSASVRRPEEEGEAGDDEIPNG